MIILQLTYFCAACKCGSITRASGELVVTQPTITSAIRQLEKEYHMELLDRKDKGVKLTPEGLEFYESGKNLLRSNKMAALTRFFKENGLDCQPNVVGRYDQLNTALDMIRRNAGCGYFPEEGVRTFLKSLRRFYREKAAGSRDHHG